jgi:DNA mismatch endonuclease (patch repair protein)
VFDKLTPGQRSENMRRIRSRDTSPEMIVRRLIHGMGYRYRLHSPKLPGRPDLALTRLRKIVDVRGCFWHKHDGCPDSHIPRSRANYWRPKLLGNRKRDLVNTQKLKALGWKVLIIWECDTKEAKRLVARIRRFLEN